MLRYSLALKSIFIIKVDFPANIDILTYGNDTSEKNEKIILFRFFAVFYPGIWPGINSEKTEKIHIFVPG